MGKASKQTKNVPSATKALKNATREEVSRNPEVTKELVSEHLPPIGLVFTVIACSGFLFMFSFRDVFATGKNIAGVMDNQMLHFTKSVDFFDDAMGWKSTQGGLSAIQYVTTDANNMGGLFVRKIGGAAGLAIQVQKLMPLLVHPFDARWKQGHFRPLFWTSVVANMALGAFYVSYMGDLVVAGADGLAKIFVGVIAVETIVVLAYLFSSGHVKKGHAVAFEDGKAPNSIVSRIAARTVAIVSGVVAILAVRDLFFPGQIIDYIPRDDIYLEWTGAFIHSPPEGTPEADDHDMESAFFVGDKFLCQLMGLNLLIMCLYKFVAAFFIRYGSDGAGKPKARMIWKAQATGNALIMFLFRCFTPAAQSASWDLRWALMAFAYETFILGVYGFF